MEQLGNPSLVFRTSLTIYSVSLKCTVHLQGTFFTPVGELGFAFQMFEVSLLLMGELPYEEYVPTVEELNQLKEKYGSI